MVAKGYFSFFSHASVSSQPTVFAGGFARSAAAVRASSQPAP